MAQRTVVIKIGGSIITQKHRVGVFIRRQVLARIADECKAAIDANPELRLIMIHGAGAGGHQIAHHYDLGGGTCNDPYKTKGALEIRVANQKLNLAISEIFLARGLPVAPVHTASAITQTNGIVNDVAYTVIDGALSSGCLPLLYGEMVYDDALGMSICSGDAIAMNLAKQYQAESVIFASDIDGIYDKDPHVHTDAQLITAVLLSDLNNNDNIALSGSHNVDVTGGLKNKIAVLSVGGLHKELERVVVCNGLRPGVIGLAISGVAVGTVVSL